MPKDKVIVGVDIGSSKICAIIATVPPDEKVNVIGVSSIPSRGMRKGQIVDIEEAVAAITECLDSAERMAGYSVGSAIISVSGTHIECQNSKGVVAVSEPHGEIDMDDVKRVIDAAKAISLSSSREIIHVIPRHFTIDSQAGIKDPVGMTGVRLEVETHIVTGATTSLRNLAKSVAEVGIGVDDLVYSGIASSEAVLTETEKELGVVLVDIGGGTIDITMFVDGSLAYSSVLPVGAKNITNDLAIGLRISLESAEKIKIALSQKVKFAVEADDAVNIDKLSKDKKKDDTLDLSDLGLDDDVKTVSRKTLVDGIIKPRMTEIINMIKLEVQKSGLAGLLPAGVVVTGGGAETAGILDLFKRELAMPARVGLPSGATGLIDEISGPAYSTCLGLVLYGAKTENAEGRKQMVGMVEIKGLVGKGVDWVKSFLP